MPEWIVYSKPDCSLCDEMQWQLAQLLGERGRQVRVVDISDQPQLEATYGNKVPALVINGELVCVYRLRPERLRKYLADADHPL
jgi:hypothetical protein